MSISSRITSIQEHIGDIYDTLELGGADLTNTNKNLENVSPVLQQKYLDYMNNGTQEIWNNWEKVTGTGKQVTLNNTVQAPMDLGVKGDTFQQSYTGKNKLNVPKEFSINTSATISISLSAGTYHLTCDEVTLGGTNPIIIVVNGGAYPAFYAINTNTNTTFTTTSDISSVTFYSNGYSYPASQGITSTVKNLMISSSGGNYEPYCGGTASPNPSYPQSIQNVTGDVEVLVQNKNLFDFANYTYDKTIQSAYRFIEIKNIKPNTRYTIYNYNNLTGSGFDNVYLSKSPSYSGISFANLVGASYQFFDTDSTGKAYLCTYASSWTEELWNTFINYFKNAMFVEGTDTATTYTPHQEQTFTFPLGNQRMYLGDYLADDGIHHVRGQVVLDGDENFTTNSAWNGTNTNCYIYALGTTSIDLLSNYFNYKSNAYSNDISGSMSIVWSNNLLLRIDNTLASDVNAFKTWLSTHNTIVEYELAEETVTPYTIEQQTVYNQIKQAKSYMEQTNISGTSDELEPIFEVVALKNI